MNDENSDNRLASLQGAATHTRQASSKRYSTFIRVMRFALPLLALIIVTLIFVWPNMDDTIAPLAQENILPDLQNAQNQLIKARYEGIDGDMQPFTITAIKAVQDQQNPMLVNLEKPTADLLMKDGAWLAAKANSAIYEQNTEKLTLKGNVRLFHDAGYQLQGDEMLVNIRTQSAFSNKDVTAQGPEGTINAVGMDASGEKNIIIFTGPATMTLNTSGDILTLGKAMPQ